MRTIDTTKTFGEVLDMLETEFFQLDVETVGLGLPRLRVNFERNGLIFELEIKEVNPKTWLKSSSKS